jgi:hypothetical protein
LHQNLMKANTKIKLSEPTSVSKFIHKLVKGWH